jgi:hypothetical protein
MGSAIAVTDEDVLFVDGIGCTVTCCFKRLLVAFDEKRSTTVSHVFAFTVEIGSIDSLASPYGNPVGAFLTSAAIVPRYKQIIPATMLEDKRCLDGVRTRIF